MTGRLDRLTVNLQRVFARVFPDDGLERLVPRAFADLCSDPIEAAARVCARQLGEERVAPAVPGSLAGRAGRHNLDDPSLPHSGGRPMRSGGPVKRSAAGRVTRAVNAGAHEEGPAHADGFFTKVPGRTSATFGSVPAAASLPILPARAEGHTTDNKWRPPSGGGSPIRAVAAAASGARAENHTVDDRWSPPSGGNSPVSAVPADASSPARIGTHDLNDRRLPPSHVRPALPDGAVTQWVNGAAALSAVLRATAPPSSRLDVETALLPATPHPVADGRMRRIVTYPRGAARAPSLAGEPPIVSSAATAAGAPQPAPLDVDELFDELERRLELEYLRTYGTSRG